tara:strand:+ start:658 stop:1071 length:414 start_codon:yes stop_codon:yes gene_type:complete
MKKTINKTLDGIIKNFNESKLFAALALLMLNVGSKHIDIELTPAQIAILRHPITKQLLIFSIAWLGSKDIYTALIVTCGFFILTEVLLNGKSNLNILPNNLKQMEQAIDANNDGIIQEKELDQAIEILNKYKKNIIK